ncbi:MAG: tail fiber protein, partial [Rhodospirillaceae bacterium]
MKFKLLGAAAAACAMATAVAPGASAQEPYLGEITIFPYNFCPRGWAPADGQLLPIAQNTALFSLYGTMYGGDGRTTFALPDLRGRVAMHHGHGPGLTLRRIGEKFGSEANVVSIPGLPAHTHGVPT